MRGTTRDYSWQASIHAILCGPKREHGFRQSRARNDITPSPAVSEFMGFFQTMNQQTRDDPRQLMVLMHLIWFAKPHVS